MYKIGIFLNSSYFYKIKIQIMPSAQIMHLVPFSNKNNQDFLEQWFILGLGQEIYKMSQEYFVVLEK